MKILAYLLTIIASVIIWLASLYATVILGWLIFCWQCGTAVVFVVLGGVLHFIS